MYNNSIAVRGSSSAGFFGPLTNRPTRNQAVTNGLRIKPQRTGNGPATSSRNPANGRFVAFLRFFVFFRRNARFKPHGRGGRVVDDYSGRVFGCDLAENLNSSSREIPLVVKCCAEFIERCGITDGIYRLSGVISNIDRLRRTFDEERLPDFNHESILQDVHSVASLLKLYFRELPDPLLTYKL